MRVLRRVSLQVSGAVSSCRDNWVLAFTVPVAVIIYWTWCCVCQTELSHITDHTICQFFQWLWSGKCWILIPLLTPVSNLLRPEQSNEPAIKTHDKPHCALSNSNYSEWFYGKKKTVGLWWCHWLRGFEWSPWGRRYSWFQLCKAGQHPSVCTLAWIPHEAISGKENRFQVSSATRWANGDMSSSAVSSEITQGLGNRTGPRL